jgi:hypothetical protein
VYAPHFAAALAIRSRVPRAPLWALLTGAFLPDLLWIVLSRIGTESADSTTFFDDWSHSLLSVLLLGVAFGALFWRKGLTVVAAAFVAVLSHFALDFPVHPKRLALYPHSGIPLGWNLLDWGSRPGVFGAGNDWWLQLIALSALMFYCMRPARETPLPLNLILASFTLLMGLQLLMLFPCISY